MTMLKYSLNRRIGLISPSYLNGIIKFRKTEIQNLLPYPKDLTQGLTFETFHGFRAR